MLAPRQPAGNALSGHWRTVPRHSTGHIIIIMSMILVMIISIVTITILVIMIMIMMMMFIEYLPFGPSVQGGGALESACCALRHCLRRC